MLNNKESVSDIHDAVRKIGNFLKEEKGMPKYIENLNKGRYKILIYNDESILCCYKREMYLKFEDGRGESVNEQDLNFALERYKIKRICICYSDGKIYVISPFTVKNQGILRTTDAEEKQVYSFPVKLLIRLNND